MPKWARENQVSPVLRRRYELRGLASACAKRPCGCCSNTNYLVQLRKVMPLLANL